MKRIAYGFVAGALGVGVPSVAFGWATGMWWAFPLGLAVICSGAAWLVLLAHCLGRAFGPDA
jgi:hypothetical protein